MAKFKPKSIPVEAHQLTIDNLDYVEKWCGGQIKGVRL